METGRRLTEPLMQVKAPCVFSKKTMSVCKNCSKGFPLNKSATQEKIDRQDPIVYLSLIPIFMGRALIILISHQGVVQYNMVQHGLSLFPSIVNTSTFIYIYRVEKPQTFSHLHLPPKTGEDGRFPPSHFFPILLRPRSSESGLLRDMSKSSFPECCPIGVEMFF